MREDRHPEKRFDAAAQATEWDSRYSERDGAMWSGRPNGRLRAEAAGLTPGRALDVGCGEGADAIWLARRGWTVTAIDVSDVAVGRARAAADLAGVTVEWVCGDAAGQAAQHVEVVWSGPSSAAVPRRGLTKRFGTVTALDGLSLTAPAGQVLALPGPVWAVGRKPRR